MSFNTNDINHLPIIDRSNYEEYFLMYVDDELTAEEKTAVEDFAAANPDLKIELDVLLSTKLDAESVVMENKQELLAEHMQLQDVDESLLLYIDDELSAAQKKAFEHKLKSNQELQVQYQWLQKTKLDKNEEIAYPDKKELYRSTRRVASIWLRVAAAIIIIIGAALLFWLKPATTVSTPAIVHHTTPTVEPSHPSDTMNSVIPQKEETTIAMEKEKAGKEPAITTKAANVVKETNNVVPETKYETASATQSSKNNKVEEDALAALNHIDRVDESIAVNPMPTFTEPSKQIVPKIAVTSANPETYTITKATYHTMNSSEDVADDNSSSKVHLKGFLRKATRFIERTTNIRPVNDDQELLIGAVAISLK